jgi:hypothetical protein
VSIVRTDTCTCTCRLLVWRFGPRHRTSHSTEWRPRRAGWHFGSRAGAAIGELIRSAHSMR